MVLVNLIVLLLLGGVLAAMAEKVNTQLPRWVSLATVLIGLVYFTIFVFSLPDGSLQLVPQSASPESWLVHIKADWIPRFGISFELALDGLSLLMVLLTLFLAVVAIVSSWTEIKRQTGFFQFNLLWTIAGVLGVFLSVDLFLFFTFWEVMLVPMYFLIAIWGHEGRAYASMKFFIFTQVSGLLMLFSILTLVYLHHQASGSYSFSYFDLLGTEVDGSIATWLMLGFFIAFVVKLPAFPFHTWLPDAHTQAPTAGSVILAGVLLKTGAYGLLRFTVPLFPEAALAFAPTAMALGAAGVVYGAVLAFAQKDFKRLVAYSSVSHMGFVLLGVFAWNALALQGAVMQMIAHGLSTAGLFMIAGSLQERLHTRNMEEMGGLWANMPRMGAVALFFAVASLGMPGLGNFVAEFLVLAGLFAIDPIITAVAALGLITGAIYSLIMIQKAFQGVPDLTRQLPDFGWREMTVMLAMIAGLIWLGLYPQPVIDVAAPVLEGLQTQVSASVEMMANGVTETNSLLTAAGSRP
jgi:NADH-quinone oxidoreductase subunit M